MLMGMPHFMNVRVKSECWRAESVMQLKLWERPRFIHDFSMRLCLAFSSRKEENHAHQLLVFERKCLYFFFFLFLWHVFNFKLVHAKHTLTHLTHKLYRFGFWISSITWLFVWCHFLLNWCVRHPIEQSIGPKYYDFPMKKKQKKYPNR